MSELSAGDTGKSPLLERHIQSAHAAHVDATAHPLLEVADSLKKIAGKVDDGILNGVYVDSQSEVIEKRDRTIWDINYEDFRAFMRQVYRSLDNSVLETSSGWEMAALVYRGVAGLVRDLRQQSGSQSHGSRREGVLQGYVGNFLEEIGLMTWITGQGGLVSGYLMVQIYVNNNSR